MKDEITDSSNLYILIDIKKENKFPLFVRNQMEKIDLINEIDMNLKQMKFNLGEMIVIEYSQSENFSGVLAKIVNIEKTNETSLRMILLPLHYIMVTKRIDFNGFFKVKVENVRFEDNMNDSDKNALMLTIKDSVEKLNKSMQEKLITDDIINIKSKVNLLLLIDAIIPILEISKKRMLSLLENLDVEKRARDILLEKQNDADYALALKELAIATAQLRAIKEAKKFIK